MEPAWKVKVPERERQQRIQGPALRRLLQEFDSNAYPTKSRIAMIAAEIGLSDRKTQIWFQNRRQRIKREGNALKRHSHIKRTPAEEAIASILSSRSLFPPVPKAAHANPYIEAVLTREEASRAGYWPQTLELPSRDAASLPSNYHEAYYDRNEVESDEQPIKYFLPPPLPTELQDHRSANADRVDRRIGTAHRVEPKLDGSAARPLLPSPSRASLAYILHNN